MQEPHPSGTDTGAAERPVAVLVTRTGGFAGLTKRWRAEPPESEASEWIALISQCPWDAVETTGNPRGADRFTWAIHARCGEEHEHDAELADDDLVGAWRQLVDAVREWSRTVDADADRDRVSDRRNPSSSSPA
ncbi:protealysin inhibitor emfourin [Microbacterium sp. NPDC057407]|uniref:protealysin inhibitor emfourin n=1 Tax=Microbacterium sp. NPDC057407 TaxID=3346120 RepID=UPI003671CC9A